MRVATKKAIKMMNAMVHATSVKSSLRTQPQKPGTAAANVALLFCFLACSGCPALQERFEGDGEERLLAPLSPVGEMKFAMLDEKANRFVYSSI